MLWHHESYCAKFIVIRVFIVKYAHLLLLISLLNLLVLGWGREELVVVSRKLVSLANES